MNVIYTFIVEALFGDKRVLIISLIFSLASVFLTYYFTSTYKEAKYNKVLMEIEQSYSKRLVEVAKKQAALQSQADIKTKQLIELNVELERKWANEKQKNVELNKEWQARVDNGFRLVDSKLPNSTNKTNTMPNTNISNNTNSTTGCNGNTKGELSQQSTQFLLNEAIRADEVVEQLKVCQAYAKQLKKEWETYNEETRKQYVK